MDANTLKGALSKAGLAPGPAESLIPSDFNPTIQLDVSYAGKQVQQGNFFRASELKVCPGVKFKPEVEADSRASYTLMFVASDTVESTRQDEGFFRHWVIPGLEPLSGGMVAETKFALTPYRGPEPADDSTPNSHLFLLYREPRNLDMKKDDIGGDEVEDRRVFKPMEFAQKHELALVAVNWLTCTPDGWKSETEGQDE